MKAHLARSFAAALLAAVLIAPAPAAAQAPQNDVDPARPLPEPADAIEAIDAPSVIFTTELRLGVNPEGHLNVIDPVTGGWVGLVYEPTGGDAIAPGCQCEGWGIGDEISGVSGWASHDNGGVSANLVVEEFVADALSAVSTVTVGGVFRVVHAFQQAESSAGMFELAVTVSNIGTEEVSALYRRAMDWDVPPTEFDEFVTIQGGSALLRFSSNDGFAFVDPLSGPTDIGATGTFVDFGPTDHGALFDLDLGLLAPGGSRTFRIYYGAAPDEVQALAMLAREGVELYSLGQPNVPGGPTLGEPNTFVFGFTASSLTLEPSFAQGSVGTGHLLTAQLRDPATGETVPDVPIHFDVTSGPNQGAEGTCFDFFDPFGFPDPCATDFAGRSIFLYEGTAPGEDTITAWADLDGDGFRGFDEPSALATMDWNEPATYLGLGDSFSSGEGVEPYFAGTDEEGVNMCHRSRFAYSRYARVPGAARPVFDQAGDLEGAGWGFVACSGARARNLRSGGVARWGEEPQLDQPEANADVDYVALTIGGNDALFAPVLGQLCALGDCLEGYTLLDGFFPPVDLWLPAIIEGLHGELVDTYREILATTDGAPVFLLGYPRLFPAAGGEQPVCVEAAAFDPDERAFTREMGALLDSVIAAAAAEAGVHFFPVADWFAGHEVCADGPDWIAGAVISLDPVLDGDFPVVDSGSFHPNAEGQAQYGAVLNSELQRLVDEGVDTTAAGLPVNPAPIAPLEVVVAAEAEPPPYDSFGLLDLSALADPGAGTCSDHFAAGDSVRVTGTGLAPGSAVELGFQPAGGVGVGLGSAVVDASGGLDAVVTLPGDATDGLAAIVAEGADPEGGSALLVKTLRISAAGSACDVTAPAITISSPADGAVYTPGQVVVAQYDCADDDGGLGLLRCSGPVLPGDPLTTLFPGTYEFTVDAWDVAGNHATATHTYSVEVEQTPGDYVFQGFFPPVRNPPQVNVAKAGRTLPVKWNLTDPDGVPVDDPESFVRLAATEVDCETGAPLGGAVTVGTPDELVYQGDARWQLDWKTEQGLAGSCQRVEAELADGPQDGRAFEVEFR